MKKYLVTGGAGFIGCHLVEKLVGLGKNVMVYDNLSFGREENIRDSLPNIKFVKGDLNDDGLLEESIKGFLPDIVFHLAAIHFIPYCNSHPIEAVKVNIDGTHNLLNICSRYKPKKVLFASSAAVYPPSDKPHRETDDLKPFDIYGATKICGETLMQLFAQQTSVPSVSCRFFNIYGPKETNEHVLPHIMDQLKQGKNSIRLGNISPKRDYIYTSDIVEALYQLSEADISGHESYNIGTANEYSVQELVQHIKSILNQDLTIDSVSELKRKTDRPHLCSDIKKLKEKVNWRPEYDIHKGLKALVDYELKDK